MNFDQPKPFENNPYEGKSLEQLATLLFEPENISPRGLEGIFERAMEIFNESSPDAKNNFKEALTVSLAERLTQFKEFDNMCDKEIRKFEIDSTTTVDPDLLNRFHDAHFVLKERLHKLESILGEKLDSFEDIPNYGRKITLEFKNVLDLIEELQIIVKEININDNVSYFLIATEKFLDFCRTNGLDVKYKQDFDKTIYLRNNLERSKKEDLPDEQRRNLEESRAFMATFYGKLSAGSERALFDDFTSKLIRDYKRTKGGLEGAEKGEQAIPPSREERKGQGSSDSSVEEFYLRHQLNKIFGDKKNPESNLETASAPIVQRVVTIIKNFPIGLVYIQIDKLGLEESQRREILRSNEAQNAFAERLITLMDIGTTSMQSDFLAKFSLLGPGDVGLLTSRSDVSAAIRKRLSTLSKIGGSSLSQFINYWKQFGIDVYRFK